MNRAMILLSILFVALVSIAVGDDNNHVVSIAVFLWILEDMIWSLFILFVDCCHLTSMKPTNLSPCG